MTIPQHSSENDCWYTPQAIIDAARTVLGGIDFDPASDMHGNARVHATTYYDEQANGIQQPWVFNATIFLNPPGGEMGPDGKMIPKRKEGEGPRKRGASIPLLFWAKLMKHREAKALRGAIVVAFTLEQLARTQGHGVPCMLDFPTCVPAKRLRYETGDGKPGMSPPHASAIVYVPGTEDHTAAFRAAFGPIGRIVCPLP